MISKYLEGCLTKSTLKQLSLNKKDFTWYDSNGKKITDRPTMLKVLINKINPSTRVRVGNLMSTIETATLAKYNENVDEMLKHLQETYNRILKEGETYPHFLQYLFEALLMVKNLIFANTIQRMKDAWDVGQEVTHEELIEAASKKYKNMVAEESWNRKDPRDVQIAALTTLVQTLTNRNAVQSSSSAAYTSSATTNSEEMVPN